ncbi:MAG: metalloregulator ArsR/SmtB family transcription factor [Planctomycetota bacterium]
MSANATAGARLFKCLSEGVRLRILRLLAEQELNVAELTSILELPQSTLSRHLAVLREGGLLATRRQGNAVFHRFRAPERIEDEAGRAFADLLPQLLADEPFAAEDRRALARVLDERRARSREHFELAGHTWDEFQGRYADHDLKALALARLVPRDLVVLDVGAGSGYLFPELAGVRARVIAIDHSPSQLQKARARAEEHGLRDVEFREGDFASLPVRDGEADAAMLHLALHHAPAPEAVLRDLRRALRPGGTAVITEFLPHEESWLEHEHADLWMGFAPEELAASMRAAGFRDIRIETRPFARDASRDRSGLASGLEVFVISGRTPHPNED